MLATVLRLLFSKLGLSIIGAAAIVIVIGLHFAGDAKIKHDRDQARADGRKWHDAADSWKAAAGSYKAALALSERRRGEEFTDAKSAAGDASAACAARLTAARRSATAIRKLLEKPVEITPGTNCPARRVYGADELRHALEARP